MSIFIEGMTYGLIFFFSLGPGFLALLQTAIHEGFVPAVCLSLGLIFIDAVLIAVILIGLGPVFQLPEVKFWMGLLGAVILIVFGLFSWRQQKVKSVETDSRSSYFSYWLKGVAINGLNPLIIVFWIGLVGAISALDYTVNDQVWFFGGFLCTMVIVDMVKAGLITRLSKYVTDKRLLILNRIVGTIFMFFGVRIFVYVMGWF